MRIPISVPRLGNGGDRPRILLRVALAVVVAGSVVAGLPHVMGASASSQPSLMADAGQFFSVPVFKVLDTRTGVGEPSNAQPLAAGATIQVQVTGQGNVPSGIEAVVVDVIGIAPPSSGYLTAWDSDSSDPGVSTVGLTPGVDADQTDTIPVGASGAISFTNHSSGSLDVVVTVSGYYTGTGASAAGSTYAGVPWSAIANSTTGLGTTQAPIPAGGSRTIQVGGVGGIPAAAGIAALQVNAFGATSDGFLTVYPAGSAEPTVRELSYAVNGPIRRNLINVPLSSSGQVTITNGGAGPVDFTVYGHGYFLPASATPAAGEYTSFDPDMLVGTATSAVALGAGATMLFPVGGDEDIPSTGVAEVAEEMIVTNPAAAGELWAGNSSTSLQPVVGFAAGNGTGVGYDQTIVIPVSGDGQEKIRNSGTGTVNVQIAAVGYYQSPHEPGVPTAVTVTRSGTTATVSWAAPDTDGGSPITSYTVTSSPDSGSVTVDGGTFQATLTGLANAAADSFSVTAANAIGTSGADTAGTAAQTVTGTVTAPSGTPVAGATVTIEDSDPPSTDPATWTPDTLGTATTDANGNWSFTVPSYASLPSGAQAAATDNGGYLNVDAYASGAATVGGTQYEETAVANGSAWVGTVGQAAAPASSPPAALAMTMKPAGVDQSALDTPANEATTAPSLNDPMATDANGNFIGNAANAYTAPATDAYGYQEIGGNGTYNPYMAADGTDLSAVPTTPAPPCSWSGWSTVSTGWAWTAIGEQHAYWDATGKLTYTVGASDSIEIATSFNGGAYSGNGFVKWSRSSSWSTGIEAGPWKSYINVLAINYVKQKRTQAWPCTATEYRIIPAGMHNPGPNSSPYKLGPSVLWEDGYGPWANTNPNYRAVLYPKQMFCDGQGSAFSYGDGVSVFGIGLKVAQEYNHSTQQCITEGAKTNANHDAWGSNAWLFNRPARFFSY